MTAIGCLEFVGGVCAKQELELEPERMLVTEAGTNIGVGWPELHVGASFQVAGVGFAGNMPDGGSWVVDMIWRGVAPWKDCCG